MKTVFNTYQQQSAHNTFRVLVKNIHPLTLVSEINSALEKIRYSIRIVTNILHYQIKNLPVTTSVFHWPRARWKQ